MKALKFVFPVFPKHAALFLTACLALAVSSPTVRADDDDDDDEHEHHEQKARIVLQPTPDAPADAQGRAEIESEDDDGVVAGHIEVKARGLLPGTYTVMVYNRAQDVSAVLGTFTISGNDDDGDDDDDEEGPGQRDDDDDEGDDDDGEGKFPLPDGIGVLDVGVISIADANGVEVLRGDFASPDFMLSGDFSARVPAVGGEAAPDASGFAAIKGRARRGHANGSLILNARRLPPRSTMVLNVNGTDVSSVRANRRGNLRVRKSHRAVNVFSISSVRLLTESGETALRVNF